MLILSQCPIYIPATLPPHPSASESPTLTILMLVQCPIDMPLTLPPHLCPHPYMHFCTPAKNAYSFRVPYRYASNPATPSLSFWTLNAYHAYSQKVPYRYASYPTTPSLPSSILALFHCSL
ncbi:hypothetical protein O181_039714 [Austropuccinia psidii MF-1]|uniref:Uncharacterized protein n=1 Tax=Austropuccinia psidii MF-1 TaxID=1389203 RepID=A0A9Q3DAV4_9BASI|nr:hypothetical protein [Austropuccinia psidii MF-1]